MPICNDVPLTPKPIFMHQKINYRIVFNKSGKFNKSQTGLIELEARQGKKRKYFSTKIYVKSNQFSNGLVINHPLSADYNFYLYNLKIEYEKIELDYFKQGVYINLDTLKNAVKEHSAPSAKFVDFGIEVVNGSSRKEHTKESYMTFFRNMQIFKKDVLLSEIDYNFIMKYNNWLKQQNIMHNTIVGRLRNFKAILNEAKRRKLINENPFDNFKIPAMTNKKGYLTKNDIKKLEDIVLDGKENKVRNAFLFAIYTGLRFSDVTTLKNENIADGWLKKKMIKTEIKLEIPIDTLFDGKALNILAQYKSPEAFSKSINANGTTNQILKTISQKAKLSKIPTFHMARHTFATILLEDGVPVTTVQKLLGHTKISTTMIYSEINENTIQNDIKKTLKKKK